MFYGSRYGRLGSRYGRLGSRYGLRRGLGESRSHHVFSTRAGSHGGVGDFSGEGTDMFFTMERLRDQREKEARAWLWTDVVPRICELDPDIGEFIKTLKAGKNDWQAYHTLNWYTGIENLLTPLVRFQSDRPEPDKAANWILVRVRKNKDFLKDFKAASAVQSPEDVRTESDLALLLDVNGIDGVAWWESFTSRLQSYYTPLEWDAFRSWIKRYAKTGSSNYISLAEFAREALGGASPMEAAKDFIDRHCVVLDDKCDDEVYDRYRDRVLELLEDAAPGLDYTSLADYFDGFNGKDAEAWMDGVLAECIWNDEPEDVVDWFCRMDAKGRFEPI